MGIFNALSFSRIFQLLAHPFNLVHHLRGSADIVADFQLQSHGRFEIRIRPVTDGRPQNFERLRVRLSIHGQARCVFARRRDGADFSRLQPPMRDGTRLCFLEPRFLPDLWILRRRCPQLHQFRLFVVQVPRDAIQPGLSFTLLHLADHVATRIENLQLDCILGGFLQRIVQQRASAAQETIRRARL